MNHLTEIQASLLTQINNCKEYIEWLGDNRFEQTLEDLEDLLVQVGLIKLRMFGEQ